MKYYELEKSDQASVHDAILDAVYDIENKYIEDQEIAELFEYIPENIHYLALQWDWSDTEVREHVYLFIKENYSNIQTAK